MGLLTAGLLIGKALMNQTGRQGTIQIARTSAMSSAKAHTTTSRRQRRRTGNPFTKEEMMNRIGGCGIRSSRNASTCAQQPSGDEDWVAVYRYPGIRGCQLFARAKFVQTLASVSYLPYSTYQYSLGTVDAAWFYSTAALAIAAPTLLALFSRYINRLVGVIAMTDDEEWIRVGYLTFWGRRKNKFIRVDDVLPLSESGFNEKDKVVKMSWYSGGGDHLFLPTEYCEILDEDKAELLFGNVKLFEKKTKTE